MIKNQSYSHLYDKIVTVDCLMPIVNATILSKCVNTLKCTIILYYLPLQIQPTQNPFNLTVQFDRYWEFGMSKSKIVH
jgi:hypothetical protein